MTENSPLPPILGQAKGQVSRADGNRLHILTLTPFYPNEHDDAVGCFVAEPLEAFNVSGIRNSVFAVQAFYHGKVRSRRDGVQARWLRYFSLPGGTGLPTAGAFVFARIVSLVRELHRSDPIDLIHAHAALPCGHAAMLLKSELGLPYVVSVHGLDAFSTQQVRGRAGEWCRRISQRVYQSSQRVVCVSELVREQVLVGTSPSCRTSVVYNGVDPNLFAPGDEGPADAARILSVGDLIPTKGHDVLLRAVASCVAEFPSISLEIIGDGPEQPRLEALARSLGIQQRVSFLGRQRRQRVAAAMRRCTTFALPSRYEGLGCVYLEAMSTGKPVIGCRGQGIAEIVRHGSNGFLVGPDNDRELALAIAMLLRDTERRRSLGIAARDTVLDRFTLTEQASHLARIYRESVR